MLVGRDGERDHVERLLGQASSGRSAALVIRGEAGIGKSALLDHAVATAHGMRVLRGVGIESEAELAFGALHLLLYPHLDRLDVLPGPQAAALRAAFGLSDSTATNPFLIGAATLTLLAELAAEKPLLCLVDDAQWLDRGSSDALLFAARRFQADPVAMLFAVRDTAVPFHTPGIEELRLPGLSSDAAAGLLDHSSPGLTAPMRARVLEEANGNPLALLELGAARLAAQREGRAEPAHQVGPLPVTRRVQETFREQIVSLPEASQSILLVAAADRFAGMDTVLSVARAVGADISDLDAAERTGLISVSDGELAFRHPLVRAAAYQCATHHQRIAVHRAFADALTAPDVLDRRAWHLAAATTEPDEAVAAELERTALRAERRGGAMAVSAAYDRAGRLSVDPELKARRIAKAALAAYDAGKPDRAARLAVEVTSLTTEVSVIAEVTLLRGQIEYERTSPEADAALASEAARLIMDSDPERAVVMLTEMMCAGRDAGALPLVAEGGRLMAELRLRPESTVRASADAQISWGDLLSGRPENAVGPLRAMIKAGREDDDGDLVHRVVAGFSGLMLAEDEAAIAVMEMLLAEVRASGALTWIPYAQEVVALAQALRGDFLTAQTCLAEAVALSTEFGMNMEVAVLRATSVWLAAVMGDEPRCRELAAEVLPVLEGRHAVGTAVTYWGLGLLDLAAGRYRAAFDALYAACVSPAKYDFPIRAVADLVEAAVRDGNPDRIADQFTQFERWAVHVDSPVATALLRRCQAMLEDSEEHYRAALDLYAKHGGRFDQARTQLLYGEWLRRRRRRSEARAELDAALTGFKRMGALTWEARATSELTALGERPTLEPVADDPLKNLTPQEVQVVRLAATGLSNKEIGAQLFLSPRTIGHHLYRAYPKLGVTRRIELAQLGLE